MMERRLRGRAAMRMIVIWLSAAATLLVLSLAPGAFEVKSVGGALVAAAAIALINALVWPVILLIALPLTVLTLGLGVVVVNGAVILLVAALAPGVEVGSLAGGIVVALVVAVVTTVVTSLLAIDDEGFWYRNVVKRYARRAAPPADTDTPGLFFLEIDGLAHDVLERAMRDGNAPFLASLVRDGSHVLTRWETDWSSQTGACQAGLLHGNNHDMPAFRWWEKERGRAIVTNHPHDAEEIERRHSDGRGLLFSDGASRANIVSGDAPYSLLTMSTALDRSRHGRIGRDYFAYFASPYNVMRTFALVVREVFSERHAARLARRRDVHPRIERSWSYALVRAWATVVQRDLQVAALVGDLYAGRPVAYTTFLGYDEVAHHSGLERPETLRVLHDVDHQIERLVRASANAPRRYEFVILSDHGQSQGTTFRDRYGETLEELVDRCCADSSVAGQQGDPSEALAYLGASIGEVAAGESRTARAVRAATSSRSQEGEVHIGVDVPAGGEEAPEVAVLASGCLGLISFPRIPGRLKREQIDALHPGLIDGLVAHEGVGFVLVDTERGGVAIGAQGSRDLTTGKVEGVDPLAPYGPNAARHVARTHSFANCPDIVVNSTYWSEADEVAAFEELVGSHGGMGGTQSHPFLLHPRQFNLPDGALIGAEHVHAHLREWLAQLGHTAYAASDGSGGRPS